MATALTNDAISIDGGADDAVSCQNDCCDDDDNNDVENDDYNDVCCPCAVLL
jgi:hypothetical protein